MGVEVIVRPLGSFFSESSGRRGES